MLGETEGRHLKFDYPVDVFLNRTPTMLPHFNYLVSMHIWNCTSKLMEEINVSDNIRSSAPRLVSVVELQRPPFGSAVGERSRTAGTM
jgi:hypothetical protein